MLGNLLFCFGGVRVGQSFVFLWGGWVGYIFCCFGGARVGSSTKTKQKITQHEPHQNKTKDCLTRTPPKQSKRLPHTNPTKTKQKIAQHEPPIFCFVLVGFMLGNLLFCFGGVRVGQSFVLFWVGFVLGNLLFSNKRLPNTNPTKTKQKIAQHDPQQNKAKDCPTRTQPKQNKRLPNTNPTNVVYRWFLVWFVLPNL
jgi:hypothetical protein